MGKLVFTLIYILIVVFSVNFFNVEGNTTTSSNAVSLESSGTKIISLRNNFSVPRILSSGPAKPIPEPINFSLFGFGFFIVVGFGWIKKNPDKH